MNIEDLLSIKQVQEGMKLVAGQKGIYNDIRWIYFADCTQCLSEDFNVCDFIRGEELVIITNKSLTENEDEVVKMLKLMSTKNICGVVISEGQISDSVITYCDDNDLPLFELSIDFHLIDLSQIICKSIAEEELNSNTKERIFSSLLFSEEIDINDAIEQANHYGIDLLKKSRVALISKVFNDDAEPLYKNGVEKLATWEKLQKYVESEFHHYGINDFLILTQSDMIALLLPCESISKEQCNLIFERICERVKKKHSMLLKVGIGTAYEYAEDFKKSYQEAKKIFDVIEVMDSSKTCYYYEDLGIYSIITQISNNKFLDNYVEKKLGKLIEADELKEGSLCDTLEAYLNCNCNANATAVQLYLHRNTMHYRMEKIKKIMGNDLQDFNELLELKFAFAILRYRKRNKE